MLTLLKKAFSRLSGSSLLNRMSTQSSPALARIARGTLRALFARTASSSSLRTKSCPLGSRMGLLVEGHRQGDSVDRELLRLAPAGHRLQGPFAPGAGGPCPAAWAPGRGWAVVGRKRRAFGQVGPQERISQLASPGVEVEGQPGVGSSGSVARPGLLGLRLIQVESPSLIQSSTEAS